MTPKSQTQVQRTWATNEEMLRCFAMWTNRHGLLDGTITSPRARVS